MREPAQEVYGFTIISREILMKFQVIKVILQLKFSPHKKLIPSGLQNFSLVLGGADMKNKNALWSYLAVVFILSYSFQLVIYFTGGVNSFLVPFMMLFPAIVAIVFRIINKEGFRNVGWGLKRWWYVFPILAMEMIIDQNILALQLSWIISWGVIAGLCLITLNMKKPVLWQASDSNSEKTMIANP